MSLCYEVLHGLLIHKNIRTPLNKKYWGPPIHPSLCYICPDKGGYFPKLSKGSETLVMTSEWLGEMFESEFADTCTVKFPLVLMVGWAEGLASVDPGARTPIGASGYFAIWVMPINSSLVYLVGSLVMPILLFVQSWEDYHPPERPDYSQEWHLYRGNELDIVWLANAMSITRMLISCILSNIAWPVGCSENRKHYFL